MIPRTWAPEVAATSTLQLDTQYGVIAHRTHLAMLAAGHPEAQAMLGELNALTQPTEARTQARTAFDATTDPLGWKLRDYQHTGREFLTSRRGTLLADAMRVGKTAQIVAAHDPTSGPLVVVAPLQTREVWIAWFKRRWPDIRPVVLQGRRIERNPTAKPVKPRRDRGYDVLDGARFDAQLLASAALVFLNYDIIGAWREFGGRRIGTLVFDEIHLISQRASRRAQGAVFMSALATRVIGATGTPIWNKPAGLYTTLACICPAAFGTFFEYATRYCNGRPGANGYLYDGTSNEAEFKQRMTEIMIRRTWEEVSGQLPAIDRAVEVVEITEAQQFQIEKEAERVRDHARQTTGIGALARFRRLLAGLKVAATVDVAARILASGEKVIVWAWHRDIALQIEEALAKQDYPGFVVSGDISMDLREDILNRWRTHPTPTPLCITLAVGQVGIDLTAARHEVFAELDFTPAVVAQAEMRPFSPLRPMAVTYVIIDHEVDRRILAALQDKCDTAFQIGVPAAESTIGVLGAAFARIADGPNDFTALAAAIMADHPDVEDLDEGSTFHGSLWTYDWEAGS